MRIKKKKKYCLGKIIHINKTRIRESYDLLNSRSNLCKEYLYKCNKCNIKQFKDYPPHTNRNIYKCLELVK